MVCTPCALAFSRAAWSTGGRVPEASALIHDHVTETYYILSGSGTIVWKSTHHEPAKFDAAPLVVNDTVIVQSSMAEGLRYEFSVNSKGLVRAFDARMLVDTGARQALVVAREHAGMGMAEAVAIAHR